MTSRQPPSASSPTPPLPLSEGEVHVWWVAPEAVVDPGVLEACAALLDEGERQRHQRFHFERHRHQFLVSHALVRATLSRYAPVAPQAWRFVTNAYGRPEVEGGEGARLRFNLSHTDGLALCAVALDVELGADVEDTQRRGETVGLAENFFAPEEVAALRAVPAALRRERFFEYWTLKEAYIKARGLGLALPLAQFAFHLSAGAPPRISFDARLGDEPGTWRFMQLRPTARHQAALAVRLPGEVPLTVRCWRTVPLGAEEPVPLPGRLR